MAAPSIAPERHRRSEQAPDRTVRDAVAARLVQRHAPGDPVWTRTIESWVDEDADRFAHARVRAFLPILIEKLVQQRLRAVGPVHEG